MIGQRLEQKIYYQLLHDVQILTPGRELNFTKVKTVYVVQFTVVETERDRENRS